VLDHSGENPVGFADMHHIDWLLRSWVTMWNPSCQTLLFCHWSALILFGLLCENQSLMLWECGPGEMGEVVMGYHSWLFLLEIVREYVWIDSLSQSNLTSTWERGEY